MECTYYFGFCRKRLVIDDLVVLQNLCELQQPVFFRRHEDGLLFGTLESPFEHRSVVLGLELLVGFRVVPRLAEKPHHEEECENSGSRTNCRAAKFQ